MEKINIYVPFDTGLILEKDATMFEIYKKNGQTINMNRFLSMLISGYYQDYSTEAHKAFSTILSDLNSQSLPKDEQQQIAYNILKHVVFPTYPPRKGKNPKPLSLKPTKNTEAIIEQIMQSVGSTDYISQYFCRMLMSYCNKPFSKREQLVFKENYEMLKTACLNRRSVFFRTIWDPNTIHEVEPYKIAVGNEELFNYLLCAETNPLTGTVEAKSYRINRIEKLYYGSKTNSLSDSVKQHLEAMIEYGPQYMINEDEESCVWLSDLGRINFNRIYYGRPLVNRIEKKEDGYYYYFKGSKDQLFFYFRRFGGDAIILSPDSLRNRMKNFYSQAHHQYERAR